MLTLAQPTALHCFLDWPDIEGAARRNAWDNPIARAILRAAIAAAPLLAGMNIPYRPVAVLPDRTRVGNVVFPTPAGLAELLRRWDNREDFRPCEFALEVPLPDPEEKGCGR